MGCVPSQNAKVVVAPPTPEENSAHQLLKSLKSKKESDKEKQDKPVDDKSSSESEKRSLSIETFTWEVYTYAEREESFKCIMGYHRSRMAFRAFFLGKSRMGLASGPSGYMNMERSDSNYASAQNTRDESVFAAWEKATEMWRIENENNNNNNGNGTGQNTISTEDFEVTRQFFEKMVVEPVNLASIPLVARARSTNTAREDSAGSDRSGHNANLQSLFLFFKSPMYLTWRAEESARVGEITATNLSVKSFSFRDSLRQRAHGPGNHNEKCSLAEMAFTLIHPPMIDHITNCSSWLGIFVAAAEGLPFALFLCEYDPIDPGGGYPIVYLNPISANLFHVDRREVIDNGMKIPHVPQLQTEYEIDPNTASTNTGGCGSEGPKAKVIVKITSQMGNVAVANYLCVKSIFDQSKRARFVLGMHGDVEKMSSRRDVKMLEVLLGILPDNVTEDK